MKIEKNEAHIWYAPIDRLKEVVARTSTMNLLSEKEKVRYMRFKFDKDRKAFLTSRYLVRTLLSKYICDIAPEEFIFIENQYGKPDLIEKQRKSKVYFNISHTKELIVLAFSANPDLGIDAEYTERKMNYLKFAEHTFSSIELECLKDLSAEERKEKFFCYWTLKESFIKAKGMGLSLPLDQFSFQFEAGDIVVHFDKRLNECPKNWKFRLLNNFRQHQLAFAIKSQSEILIKEIFY